MRVNKKKQCRVMYAWLTPEGWRYSYTRKRADEYYKKRQQEWEKG